MDITPWAIGNKFLPVYTVSWRKLASMRGDDSPPKLDSLATIQFIVPEQRVLQLDVHQAKYIKRKPLAVPDRDRLLQEANDPKLRELWFTTEAYQAAALKVMLQEANWAARALRLPEKFPIEPSDLTEKIIETPFVASHQGRFALVHTEKFNYEAGQKLFAVSRLHPSGEDQYLAAIRAKYTMSRSGAKAGPVYGLATQWLAAISIDLKRLEADYPSQITVPWNLGDQYVPLFTVEWVKPIAGTRRRDVAVIVELLEPERLLESLVVEKPEYMAPPPPVVPDRDKLLQAMHAK